MSKPVECPTLSEIDSLVRRAIDYNEVDLLVKNDSPVLLRLP